MDAEIVLWLNNWVGHFYLVDVVARVLVSDYFVPVLGGMVLLGLWFWGRDSATRERHQRAFLTSIIGAGFSSLVVMLVNNVYFRPRPFASHELNLSLFYAPTDSSFPANPIAVAFAVVVGVWGGNKLVGVMLGVITVLYGVSRIYAGVFYPTDILAGAAIGVVVSLLVRGALHILEPLPTLILRLARSVHLA